MNEKQIPIFRLSFDEDIRQRFLNGCQQIFDEAFLTNHSFVAQFEGAFAKFVGTRFAIAVSNGTTALELVLRAHDISGKHVLLPTNTFIASAVAVRSAQGIVRPLDIESQTFTLSLEQLEKRLDSSVGAVMLVHIGGLISSDVLEIAALCKARNIPLIEDCAHAHGSVFQGRHVGRFGIAGCFSFFPTKVMTTGEGGMVVTDSEELYQRLISLRQFGKCADRAINHELHGINGKMSEFQALLGLLELERIAGRIQQRQCLARRYQENLSGTSWHAVSAVAGAVSSHYKQIVLSTKVSREITREELRKKNISLTGGVYEIPLHRQKVFHGLWNEAEFPVSNIFSKQHFCPPCYPELSLDEVDRVCEVLCEIERAL